jgi:hypothetical protein
MRKLVLVFTAFVLMACTSAKPSAPTETASAAAPGASRNFGFIDSDKPQCLNMVQEFCQTLFAPENQGKLAFEMGDRSYKVNLGQTENDFQQEDFEFLKAKLLGWAKLPREFRDHLSAHDFKAKLQRHLARAARQSMDLRRRMENMRDEEEINSIWNLSFRQTVLGRMERAFPGYARIKEDFMPLELKYESERQRRMLLAKISEALWSDHANWHRVESKFAKVKKVYREVIAGHKEIPGDIKKDWFARIDSVKLIIPGSDPEIEMGSCFSNESNAYYFRDKNVITVCAGDFNTEEIEQTLAHELGHALDIGRSRFLFQLNSPFGQGLHDLKAMSCDRKPFSCDKWEQTKTRLASDADFLQGFQPQMRDFQQCLQEKPIRKTMPDDYIERVANEEVEGTLSHLARRNVFLRIISPHMPLPDGSSQRNPMHLNPCGYYVWDEQMQPLDDDVSLLLYFTAEYRCSKEDDRAEKFKHAIETAKRLQIASTKANLRMEGEFSGRYRLDRDGYASSPTERFADNLGQMVFARLLNEDSDVRRRRARYLANNAWLCRKPSIQQLFPGEAKIQRSYFVEPHSETGQRQKELLSTDIRKSLECRQDFELRQCEI